MCPLYGAELGVKLMMGIDHLKGCAIISKTDTRSGAGLDCAVIHP